MTGGTNAGVMALVGEAVSNYNMEAGDDDDKITCIGFTTWGVIKNNAALESEVTIINMVLEYKVIKKIIEDLGSHKK